MKPAIATRCAVFFMMNKKQARRLFARGGQSGGRKILGVTVLSVMAKAAIADSAFSPTTGLLTPLKTPSSSQPPALFSLAVICAFSYQLVKLGFHLYWRWEQSHHHHFLVRNQAKSNMQLQSQIQKPPTLAQFIAPAKNSASLPAINEAEAIRILRTYLEGLFPKYCPHCHHRFANFRDYLLATQSLGAVMPYDAELGDWQPLKPLGTWMYARCRCGTTLALSTQAMPLSRLWALLDWARTETQSRHKSPQELLNYLRDEINQQVLLTMEPKV